MRARSPKRAAQERQYAKLRREFLEGRPSCEYPIADRGECGMPASDVHHRRGRMGPLLTNPAHWSALCRPHHVYVTEHPAEAYALGISERRIGEAS